MRERSIKKILFELTLKYCFFFFVLFVFELVLGNEWVVLDISELFGELSGEPLDYGFLAIVKPLY
jgi:hypothetical protein